MNKMALKGKHIFKHQFFKQVMQPNHVSFKCYQLNTLEFFFKLNLGEAIYQTIV
jgi:hypothetical protein